MSVVNFTWTDDHIKVVSTLWQEGKSAIEIARITSLGLSRSAIIGKLHRLGLSDRRPVVRTRPRKEPAVIAAVVARAPIGFIGKPVRFLDRRPFECSYIISPDDVGISEKLVCGQSVVLGQSWCPDCHARVFVPRPIKAGPARAAQ